MGSRSRNSLDAFLKGAASHLFLDAIPHYDFKYWPFSFGDFLTGLALQSFLESGDAGKKKFIGALGGGLPDLEGGLVFLGLLPKRHAYFHRYLPHPRATFKRSLAVQVPIILLAVAAAKYFSAEEKSLV